MQNWLPRFAEGQLHCFTGSAIAFHRNNHTARILPSSILFTGFKTETCRKHPTRLYYTVTDKLKIPDRPQKGSVPKLRIDKKSRETLSVNVPEKEQQPFDVVKNNCRNPADKQARSVITARLIRSRHLKYHFNEDPQDDLDKAAHNTSCLPRRAEFARRQIKLCMNKSGSPPVRNDHC